MKWMTADKSEFLPRQYTVIPEIPKEIIDAINTKSLVVFIGAGISGLFNLPMWNRLATNVLYRLFNEKVNGKRIITHSTKEALFRESDDPRRLLSILYEICDDKDIFFKHLNSELQLNHHDGEQTGPIELLNILERWNSSIVTTNYDEILDSHLNGYDIFYSGKEISIPDGGFSKPYILHLHGSVKKNDEMIITVSQYHSMYHGDGEWENARQFLKSLFQNYTVLFIGYGLKDYEILEYTMASGRKNAFFLLEPHTQMDQAELEPLRRYYMSVNVEMLPYLIDENGYETILEVLREWELKFEKYTRIPADRCYDIDCIISKPPDELSKNKLLTMLESDNYLSYFLRNIDSSKYEYDWFLVLCKDGFFDSKKLSECYENNEGYQFRLLIVRLCETLHHHSDDITLRDFAKSIVSLVSNSPINKNSYANSLVHKKAVDLIVLLMDDLDDSILDYLDSISKIDGKASYVINSISKDINSFKQLSIDSQQSLIRYAMTHSLKAKSPSDSYWTEILYESTEGLLNQTLCQELFKTLSDIANELFSNQPYYGLTIGSIDEYLSNDMYHDEEFFLIKWIHSIISRIPAKDIIKFVNQHIGSKNHLENTIALHAINLHFDELQSIFWKIEDYTYLNYSELFDMIKNNAFHFNDEAILRFISVVQKSYIYDSNHEDLTRKYQYDLLKLLPPGMNELNAIISQNLVEDYIKFRKPEDRGKAVMVSSTWDSDSNCQRFSDITEILDRIENENLSFEESRSIRNYLENNISEIIKDPKLLKKIPFDYYPTICNSMKQLGDEPNLVFQTYVILLDNTLTGNVDYFGGCIHYLMEWSESHGFDPELVDYLFKVLESQTERFYDSKINEYEDKMIESMNNWYVGILWNLLTNSRYTSNKVVQQRILPLIESNIKNRNPENRLIICIAAACSWRYIKWLDEKWASNNYQKIIIDSNSTWVTSSYLLSNCADGDIYVELYKNGMINDLLNLELTNDYVNQSIIALGMLSSYLYAHENKAIYLETIELGMRSDKPHLIIYGVIRELQYCDEITDEISTRIIQTIIENNSENIDSGYYSSELAKYLESSKGPVQSKLELTITMSESYITHVPESLISVLERKYSDRPETIEIVNNLSAQTFLYYPESFETLVKKISQIDQYKDKVREICNRMGEKGFDTYYKIEREM